MNARRFISLLKGTRERSGGFTMIEIALSLAIVAFALVAIIGVLPTGLRVKKDNREDTIINEEGAFLLEAIRSGSHALDELTNSVEAITQTVVISNVLNQTISPKASNVFNVFPADSRFSSGGLMVGMLSWPTYQPAAPGQVYIIKSTARMRALSGSALDRGRVNKDFSFRYLATPEIIPYPMAPADVTSTRNQVLQQLALTNNLYELRLTMQWPLYPRGAQWEVGRNHKTFRTLVNGSLNVERKTNYFFQANVFTNLTLNGNY